MHTWIKMRTEARHVAVASILLVLFGSNSSAAEVSPESEYLRRLKVYQTVQPLGDTPFGENVNLYTGELSFSQTDVVLEGTGPTIVLARETITAQTREDKRLPEAFGDWTLSVPRIETLMPLAATREPAGTSPTIVTPGLRWKVPAASDPYARCSQFGPPGKGGYFEQDEWWHGYELISESGHRQQLLRRTPENTLTPTMTGTNGQPLAFPVVTSQNWQITCLPATSNGEVGEGFLAISPDGTKYYFDYLVGERVTGVVRDVAPNGRFYLQRALGTMYVSKVEDRFNNAVTYQYTNGLLTSITASDGRAVSIVWRTDLRVIDRIIVQPASPTPQIWRYEHASSTNYGVTRHWLTAVVQPDQARWGFDLNGIGSDAPPDERFRHCETRGVSYLPLVNSHVSTVTHPRGLIGTFTIMTKAHARSYVESGCDYDGEGEYYEAIPSLYVTQSLIKKTRSGPGVNQQIWDYSYSTAIGSAMRDACAIAGTCPDTKTVTVTGPDGNASRFTHITRWGPTEGKLLSTEYFQGASTLLRSETLSYASALAGPYPSRIGDSMQGWRSNVVRSETWTPNRQQRTTQSGRLFTYDVEVFDVYARPKQVSRSSTVLP